jgi:hypothetical protein
MNWEETLASYESSDQTIKAFCLVHGINQTTFKYHLYRKRRKREVADGFGKAISNHCCPVKFKIS